jgi:pimeloyl-ACP methyl ester carboxylesterase
VITETGVVAALQPLYFGTPDARLFGCYHTASGVRPADHGVLLCGPVGHEYMACHRTVRQLAMRLAQAGRPVLRFDFYGSGDSAGDHADGSLSRWLRDISEAITELERRQGHTGVSIIGLRLGATLALLHGHDREAAERHALVLWDPIVSGRLYVAELMAHQRERFGNTDGQEVLGFPFPIELRRELEGIELLPIRAPRARRVLIIETGAVRSETRALESRIREAGSVVEYRHFDMPPIWDDSHKTAVPNIVIQFVASWMRGAGSDARAT